MKDPRVDDYIASAAPFARPILKRLRKLMHAALPAVQETLKWSMPHFEHKGILFGMAGFKEHCAVFFRKGDLIVGKGETSGEAMGQLGRLCSIEDLPADKVLVQYMKKAVTLNEAGIKIPAPPRNKERKELQVPNFFQKALRQNRRALETFEGFSYSHQKEYVEWLTEAKREETRERRLKAALQWLAQGKSRHWKFR